jgi:hypothetical protein
VPPLASSGTASPPPAGVLAAGVSVFAVSLLLPPQPESIKAQATPAPIQIFFI